MKIPSKRSLGVCAAFLAAFGALTPVLAQTQDPSRVKNPLYPDHFLVPVDKTHAGQHRALAMLAYQLFQKGDLATAATVARILECEWDRVEKDFKKASPDLWKEIDDEMDALIHPIITSAKARPDPAKVQAAYEAYLKSLAKVAD